MIGKALKYAGSAEIEVLKRKDDVVICVNDNGRGIAQNQLDKVFLPFYHGEDSRSRETGGTGLELAVAQDIVMAHGGSISIQNRPQGGLQVEVILTLRSLAER